MPQGRSGKHTKIVTQIPSDLDQIQQGVALKVSLAQLTESKEKVRSAETVFDDGTTTIKGGGAG